MKVITGLLLVSILSGCAQIKADMADLSGVSSLSQAPTDSEIESAKKLRSPIAISAINAQRDSANGIDVSITFQNIDEYRVIKYVTFNVVFKNRVNDTVRGEISSKENIPLRSTGPFKPNDVSWGGYNGWSNAFYHANANQLEVISIDVDYMDGESLNNIDIQGMIGAQGIVSEIKY